MTKKKNLLRGGNSTPKSGTLEADFIVKGHYL